MPPAIYTLAHYAASASPQSSDVNMQEGALDKLVSRYLSVVSAQLDSQFVG